MIVKKLLLIIWYIRWTYEKPVNIQTEKPLRLASTSNQTKITNSSKADPPFLITNSLNGTKFTELVEDDEVRTALAALREHLNLLQPFNFSIISDDRVLYHSLTNPIHKSKTWNFFPDANNSSSFLTNLTDIHGFSTPFESSWLLFPAENRTAENAKSNGTRFKSVYHLVKIDKNNTGSIFGKHYDTLLSPSNLKLKFHNLDELNKKDSSELLKDFKGTPFFADIGDGDFLQGGDFRLGSTSSDFGELNSTPKNNTFFAYNVEEFKTPKGELQGVMHVFNENGLSEKIHYNENGVFNKTLANATLPQQANGTSTLKGKLGSSVKNTVAKLPTVVKTADQAKKNQSQKASSTSTQKPGVDKISVTFTGHNYSNSSVNPNENDPFDNPENVLAELVQQLNSKFNTPNRNGNNVRTDVQNSFHETVSESSYFLTKK